MLAHWDKGGEDNEQFVRACEWNGTELKPTFELDFTSLKLGRPHHMLFGSTKVGN
jgi:selenium-binding protein 1